MSRFEEECYKFSWTVAVLDESARVRTIPFHHGLMNTYSIALRVRRIVYEDAYISVPVTEAIMKPSADADGNVHLDTEALMAEGIRISKDARIEWRMESTTTDIHPIQQPMPEDRTSFMPDFT